MKLMNKLEEVLRIGIIQTTVDNNTAWSDKGNLQDKMNSESADMVMDEIRRGFKEFYEQGKDAPRIVLIPEYSIPHNGMKRIKKFAQAIDAVTIGGCDLFTDTKHAQNKGIMFIPNSWPKLEPAYGCNQQYFGKRFYARTELQWFKKLKKEPKSENLCYIINAGLYGNIGIAICADFYDLERFVIYKGRIHHLIIIAYNQDKHSFGFLAEAISRLLFCNVVICNTGHYGDSLAFSPYSKEYKRIIYKNSGPEIFASQVIELPVHQLDKEQTWADLSSTFTGEKPQFKWPPGYKKYGI